MLRAIIMSTCAALGLAAVPAVAQTTSVPGYADPFLAGQPNGTLCCGGDDAPAISPILGPAVTGGQVLTFNAVGGVSYYSGPPGAGADGDNDGTNYTFRYDMTADYGTGISGPKGVNVDGLVGVFLGNGVPSGAAPAQLDFTGSGMSTGLDFTSLSPGLNQIFWIGDGLTGIGTGTLQQFLVPTGATRLFFGTVDGTQWNNNNGTIRVTTSIMGGSVPEPATWGLMILGFGAIGAAMRRRATRPAFA